MNNTRSGLEDNQWYVLFSAGSKPQEVRELFMRRFGVEPDRIFPLFGDGLRELVAGPIPEQFVIDLSPG